mmetsp:Transcript_22509/g.19474  ORF Transcript_22509/g.19474 Transcript_22509/m.19474 type:complete len:85 (-) Transcript_22509:262-516(-)
MNNLDGQVAINSPSEAHFLRPEHGHINVKKGSSEGSSRSRTSSEDEDKIPLGPRKWKKYDTKTSALNYLGNEEDEDDEDDGKSN